MRRKLKGNVLLLTATVMFAVAIIATAITSLSLVSVYTSNSSNYYTKMHVNLSSQINKMYNKLLCNLNIVTDSGDEVNLHNQISTVIDSENIYSFIINEYNFNIKYVGSTAEKGIERTCSVWSSKDSKKYELKRSLYYLNNIYSLGQKEDYSVYELL